MLQTEGAISPPDKLENINLHNQAAGDHEEAARHHRKAAEHHDSDETSDARLSSMSAMEHCNAAHKSSIAACALTAK